MCRDKLHTHQLYNMNRVAPATEYDFEHALKFYKNVVDMIAAGNPVEIPGEYKHSCKARCFGTTCCCLTCCSPCLIWSTVFRVLCLPVDCMMGRPCGGNNCTKTSDIALSAVCAGWHERNKSPALWQTPHIMKLVAHAAYYVRWLLEHDLHVRAYKIVDVMAEALSLKGLTPKDLLELDEKFSSLRSQFSSVHKVLDEKSSSLRVRKV